MKQTIVLIAVLLVASTAFAEEDWSDLRLRPGFQISGFGMAGDRDDLAWGAGVQGTLFKLGQLSFGGGGISLYELKSHWQAAPYVELVTIDLTEGPGIVGITFKYVFRNAFNRQGAPLDHGLGIGIVVAGF